MYAYGAVARFSERLRLKWFRGMVNLSKVVETSADFRRTCLQHQAIQLEYLFDEDEEKFIKAAAELEERWQRISQDPTRTFVSIMNDEERLLLTTAHNFASRGFHLPRQRLITEFFAPA